MAEKRSSKETPNFLKKDKNGNYLYGGASIKKRKDYFANQNISNEKPLEGTNPVILNDEPLDAEDFFEGDKQTNENTYTRGRFDNVLHRFASYNVILTLSGISETEIEDRSFLTNTPHDIIARSGGIADANYSDGRYVKTSFTNPNQDQTFYDRRYEKKNDRTTRSGYAYSIDVLTKAHDIFFENINIVSTTGPNNERGLANFTKMDFELHEPYGTTLTEKVRAATFTNGYEDFLTAPLLLTMEFKGFDEHGKQLDLGKDRVTRKFPIVITRVEFDIDNGGTKYYCMAVPVGDMAHDDTFKFPRGVINVSAKNIDEWAKKVQEQLEEIQDEEINDGIRQITDRFVFEVDPKISELGKYRAVLSTNLAETNANLLTRLYNRFIAGETTKIDTQAKLESGTGTINDTTSLVKYFEDAVRMGEHFQVLTDAFWLTYAYALTGNDDFKPTTVGVLGDNLDDVYKKLKDYYLSDKFLEDAREKQWIDWFEIKTHMRTRYEEFDDIRKCHPKEIVYRAIPKKLHVLKFIRPGISLGNIDWSPYVVKNYDYIYSGQNLDIQNLKINYKTAYYYRNLRPREKDDKSAGFFTEFESQLNAAFGAATYPEPYAPVSQQPSNIKGASTMTPSSNKAQQFYDYITNPEADMMRLEMDILGDPIYICQDQFLPLDKDNKHVGFTRPVSGKFGSFNSEYAQPLIEMRFRMPDDINENTGLMFDYKSKYSERLWFSGIYTVTKVDTRINNGEFTQTLYGARLNNQSGERKGIKNFTLNSDGKRLIDGQEQDTFSDIEIDNDEV